MDCGDLDYPAGYDFDDEACEKWLPFPMRL
jgi:hypothetical protein